MVGRETKRVSHPRKHIFLHTTASPLRRNLFRTVRTLLKEPESTFVHDCGVESVLFLHYLWSLFTLFGSTTLFITPSIACFNYFSQDRISPADKLNMLSWSNGSTKDAKRNWLYAILVPATTGFILCLTSKNLAQAVELRRAALATQFSGSGHTAPCKYFVVVKNVPSHWGAEKIREHYAPWRDHIVCVRPVSSLRSDSLAQLRSLVRHIEQLETLFINEMIQQSLQMDAAHFRRYLSDRMRERYSGESDGAKQSWRRTTEPMPALYARLEELTLSSWNKQIRLESSASASVLITLDDYYTARAIETHPRSVGVFQCRAHFLGSSASDVVYPNISYSWSRTEIRQGLVRTLTTGLIILWTFPMAIVGGLSQISVVLQLTPEWSSFQVSDWLLGAVQGVAPSLATSVLMSLFLRLLRILVEQAKHSTNTEAQLSTQSYYFCFFFIHLFLTASIASGLVPTTFEVLNGGIAEMPRVLALNLPLAGNYYLSYLLVQGILLAASTLFRPQALIQLYYATKPRITPRAKLTAMGNTLYEVRWGEIYPFYSILAVIGEQRRIASRHLLRHSTSYHVFCADPVHSIYRNRYLRHRTCMLPVHPLVFVRCQGRDSREVVLPSVVQLVSGHLHVSHDHDRPFLVEIRPPQQSPRFGPAHSLTADAIRLYAIPYSIATTLRTPYSTSRGYDQMSRSYRSFLRRATTTIPCRGT